MTSRTLRFDWPQPPLTANQRLHWRTRARLTSDVRQAAAWQAAASKFPQTTRLDVSLTWVVKDKRRRDADNIVPTLKALCDGLVDAGIVPDDTPHYMVKHMPRIVHDPSQSPHLELHIAEVA